MEGNQNYPIEKGIIVMVYLLSLNHGTQTNVKDTANLAFHRFYPGGFYVILYSDNNEVVKNIYKIIRISRRWSLGS